MKTLKTILSVFALAAVFSSAAFAQAVNVAATVEADISVTVDETVDFAGVQANSNPVLDPNGTHTDVGAGATLGKLTIGASNTTQLVIDWDQTTVTLGDGTTNTMTFTPDITAFQTDVPGSSLAVTKATANSNTATSGSGALFVYIGGNLGALSGQATGTYSSSASNGSGDLTFTVNYQ
jgi:hypothetical protein